MADLRPYAPPFALAASTIGFVSIERVLNIPATEHQLSTSPTLPSILVLLQLDSFLFFIHCRFSLSVYMFARIDVDASLSSVTSAFKKARTHTHFLPSLRYCCSCGKKASIFSAEQERSMATRERSLLLFSLKTRNHGY